jgi:hypothetical protein
MKNERLLSEQDVYNVMPDFYAQTREMQRNMIDSALEAQDRKTTAALIEQIDRMLNNSTWKPDYHCNCDIVLNALWHTLKQSLEVQGDAWCDPTCELYDGRVCDAASNCNGRQQWKKSLEGK